MKRFYILGLILSGVILLVPLQAVNATEAEPEDEFVWSEPGPRAEGGFKWFKLTDEATERIMKRVKEKDPEKAKELEQLRDKDPQKYEAELRKIMREHFGKRRRMHRQRGMRPEHGPGPKGPHKDRMRPGFRHPDVDEPQMQQRHLEWLEETHPEKAVELEKLRDENPELFEKRMHRGMRKRRKIMHAAKKSPELAEALKESMELRDKEKDLLEKIASAKTKDEKNTATKQLEDMVSRRFDLIVKRKQIIYETHNKKIEAMQSQLARIEARISKWQDPAFKAETVKKKMEKLIGKAEEFKRD